MRATAALLRRELMGYFYRPLGWLVLTLFLLVQGYSFTIVMELLSQPVAPHGAPLQFFFGGTLLYWLFVIVTICAITMGTLASERRGGTIEPLMTAPVSETSVVLGKYLAALLFYATLWLPTLVYVAILASLSEGPGLHWGPVLSAYLGTLLVGATGTAVGMLGSAVARSQIVAALVSFTLLALFLLVGAAQQATASQPLRELWEHINLFQHMDELARGIVDTRRLVLHLSVIALSLTAAVKTLELRKWR